MVEQGNAIIPLISHVGFKQSSLVHLNPGKLRDFYRIGKMLGQGKRYNLIYNTNRCIWRGQNVRAQRNWRLKSCQGFEEESHGRG